MCDFFFFSLKHLPHPHVPEEKSHPLKVYLKLSLETTAAMTVDYWADPVQEAHWFACQHRDSCGCCQPP